MVTDTEAVGACLVWEGMGVGQLEKKETCEILDNKKIFVNNM